MTKNNELAFWAAARATPYVFMRQAFKTVYPDRDYEDNWHIHAILHALELSFKGQQQRLIVNIPPRSLKSFLVSVMWPAFVLGHDPAAKIVCVSYSEELTKVFARDFRRIVESAWYPRLFPEVKFTKSTETETVTQKGGGRFAISVGGSLTGRGADIVIIDDPLKPDDALSDKARKANNDWYQTTLLSRLDDKENGVLILVMQRLHVNDLSGNIEGTGYKKLSFPAIALKDEQIEISDGVFHHRKAGEALQPHRESLAVLATMRAAMGDSVFQAQYQQRPATPEGTLFKRHYFKTAERISSGNQGHQKWLSIDTASSTSDSADYSAMTYGVSTYFGPMHYIVEVVRGRWDYEELLRGALQYAGDSFDLQFMVEYAGAGIALRQTLLGKGYKVKYHTPNESKIVRAAKILPVLAAGRVRLYSRPGKDAWMEPLLNELMSFPNARYDDQVDSVIYGIATGMHFTGSGDVTAGLLLKGGHDND